MSSSNAQHNVLAEIRKGLHEPQKQISSKFFYNKRGSELFEKICELEEYYLTRCEIEILTSKGDEIASTIGQNCIILELGSGSSRKARILLEHLSRPYAYFPIDISKDFVTQEAKALKRDYPTVVIHPIFSDYTRNFALPNVCFDHRPCVYFYPGSSIGNFSYPAAQRLFQNLHTIHPSAHLLIGIDLKKDRDILEKAYNDSFGITARFNLNVLDHVNKLIGNCFQAKHYEHHAFYNEKKGRIEMHLRSLESQEIQLNGEVIPIKKDETILTEYSYKYNIEEFNSILNGFYSIQHHWTDSKNLFALLYCAPK